MKKASSWQLLFANPLILVPWVAYIVVVGLIQHFMTATGTYSVDGKTYGSPLVVRYFALVGILTTAYSTCMASLILNTGKIDFPEANHLFVKSIRRLFVMASVCFILSLATTVATRIGIVPLAMLLLVVFVFAFFSTYWMAAIVIGGSGVIDAFFISAKLVLQKFPRTLMLYVAPFINMIFLCFIGVVLILCHVFSIQNVFMIDLLLFLPTTASFNIAVVGEYCASYGAQEQHPQTIVEKRILTGVTWGRRIFLAIVIFGVLAVLLLVQVRKALLPHVTSVDVANAPVPQVAAPDPLRDERLAREQVTRFIEKSRSVLDSLVAEKSALDSVYGMISPKSDAWMYLDGWYPRHNPYGRSSHETDQAQVRTIQAVMPNVYRVQWSERIRDKRGRLLDVQMWEGTIRVTFISPPLAASASSDGSSVLISSIAWWKKSDIHYGKIFSRSETKGDANGYWRLSPDASYASSRAFGGPPYCRYGEALSIRQLGFRMRKTEISSAMLQVNAVESAPACPYPPPPPSDQSYAFYAHRITGKSVDIMFVKKSGNQEHSRAYLHLLKGADGKLSGTILFYRVDSAPILNWRVPISIVMEPGKPEPLPAWKSVSAPSGGMPFVTDALGTHGIPVGYQEQSIDPGVLFRSLGISLVTMQNSSSGTRIILFGMKDASAPPPEKALSSRELRSCSSFAQLPDDVFKAGDQLLSFHRLSCTASQGGQTEQVEAETGSFLVHSPTPHRVALSIIGVQKMWDANAVQGLVRSFH